METRCETHSESSPSGSRGSLGLRTSVLTTSSHPSRDLRASSVVGVTLDKCSSVSFAKFLGKIVGFDYGARAIHI